MIVRNEGRFDVADVEADFVWRFRWECYNDDGGCAPHYGFCAWDGVVGCWTGVCGSFDLNGGVVYVDHVDELELNARLVRQALRFGV